MRTFRVEGIVDTGVAPLVIPQAAADALGVPVIGEAGVRYADNRQGTKKVVNAGEVNMLGRSGIFRAIVEPERKDALIRAIVLEDMDFVVDCQLQKVISA